MKRDAPARIALRVEGPEHLTVLGDRARLFQVVSNLLSNAIKFQPPQGEGVGRTSLHDGAVEISIRDTGPGIDPAILPTRAASTRPAAPASGS